MIRAMRGVVVVVLVFVVLGGVALSGPLTVKDIVELKAYGFSEKEIRAEIEKTETKIDLSEDQVRTLKAAGFSDELIALLKPPPPKKVPLTVEGIEKLTAAGTPVEKILLAIGDAGVDFSLTPANALRLRRAKVAAAVLFAIKGQPLDKSALVTLGKSGLSEAGYETLFAIVGLGNLTLTPSDAMELRKAGLPKSIVAKLAKGGTSEPGNPVGPVDPIPSGDYAEFAHISRLFTVRYPRNWILLREVDDAEVEYLFTPEKNKTTTTSVERGISLMVLPMEHGSAIEDKDLITTFEHLLPVIRQAEPGLTPQGEITVAKLGNLDAAKLVLTGRIKEKPGTYRGEGYLAKDGGIMFIALAYAPIDEFDRHAGTFRKILADSRFGRPVKRARGSTLDSSNVVERHEESVVSVVSYDNGQPQGSGSGFIIHPAGYVATNAHVVADLSTMKPHAEFKVEWTKKLNRKMLRAKLVGWAYIPASLQMHHGVDVAILKLPEGTYKPVSMTRMDQVRLGDPVVTMGFPRRDMYATLNTFITRGVVTRFNRGLGGDIQTIFTDAKVTHGSSGGPCFSLKTGGVIGLNTFGADIQAEDRSGKQINDLVGYYGVVPSDRLMEEFPLVAGLGIDPDSPLDFYDAFSLARLSLGLGSPRAARKLAAKAARENPDSPDAYFLQALCMLESASTKEDYKQALAMLDRVLAIDANDENALLTYADVFLGAGMTDKAGPYADRAVKAHPESWRSHMAGAHVFLAWRQLDKALALANDARRLAKGIVADPDLLAGDINYQKNDLEAGLANFKRAAEIHPTNAMAWIGQGYYHELKKNWQAALDHYVQTQERGFMEDPYVLARIANCYAELGRDQDAYNNFYQAFDKFKKRSLTPTEEICLTPARMAARSEKTLNLALLFYNRFLFYHGIQAGAAPIHVEMARMLLKYAPPARGIAFAHLCRARSLNPEETDAKGELERGRWTKTSLKDISIMLQTKYIPPVVADMIEHTPLGFTVDLNNPEHFKMIREAGLPPVVVQAIQVSNKRFPPGPGESSPSATKLVGIWFASGTHEGITHAFRVQFDAKGRYASRYEQQNRGMVFFWDVENGTYVVKGSRIEFTIEYKKQGMPSSPNYAYDFTLSGNTLTFQRLPFLGGRDLVMQRQR